MHIRKKEMIENINLLIYNQVALPIILYCGEIEHHRKSRKEYVQWKLNNLEQLDKLRDEEIRKQTNKPNLYEISDTFSLV